MTPTEAFERRTVLVTLYQAMPALANRNWLSQGEDVPDTRTVLQALESAAVVLWRQDLWAAAQARNDAFRDTAPTQAVRAAGPQLWLLDHPGELDSPEWKERLEVPEDASLFCLGILPAQVLTRPAVCPFMVYLNRPPDGRTQVSDSNLAEFSPHMRLLMPQWLDEPIHQGFYWLAAPLEFMDMEFVGRLRHHHDIATRRAFAHADKPLPEVTTIQLRRAFQERHPANGEGDHREWSCQWIVAGHWRRQWYPSKAEWRPKYISPYVKGDPDKPLRQPKGAVYLVSR